jgi:hypothetical protein
VVLGAASGGGVVVGRGLETGATGDAGRAVLGDAGLAVAGLVGEAGPAAVRGGGSPDPPAAGTAGLEADRDGAKGAAGTPVRGHVGIVPVGIRSGRRGTAPGEPLPALAGGWPWEGVGRGPALTEGAGVAGGGAARGTEPLAPGGGPGTGVRTGGFETNAGPGRGMGVSIGICAIGPDAVGGSSLNGSGVNRGGEAAGV